MNVRTFIGLLLVACSIAGKVQAASIHEYIVVGGASLKEVQTALDEAIAEWEKSAAEYPMVSYSLGERDFGVRPTKLLNRSNETIESVEFYRGSVDITVTVGEYKRIETKKLKGDNFDFSNSNPHKDTFVQALESYAQRCLTLRRENVKNALWVACNGSDTRPLFAHFKQNDVYAEVAGSHIGEFASHIGQRRALAHQGDDLADQIRQARADGNARLVEILTLERNRVVTQLGNLQAKDNLNVIVGGLALAQSKQKMGTETIILSAQIQSDALLYY